MDEISIPTTLTPERAAQLTALLLEAKMQLRDAAGSRINSLNYASTYVRIGEVLRELGVESD